MTLREAMYGSAGLGDSISIYPSVVRPTSRSTANPKMVGA